MTKGGRNRLIMWAGFGIPYRPEKTDLRDTLRHVERVLDDGWVIVITGEGRIHRGERELLPWPTGRRTSRCGPASRSSRSRSTARAGSGSGRRVRVRVGEPLRDGGHATREAVDALTARTERALLALMADFPDPPPPGRFGRWLTELFNDWPEGARPALGEGEGPPPARERASMAGGDAG